MNKSRHAEVKIVNAEAASDLVNSPRFSTLDELSDTCFEVIIIVAMISSVSLLSDLLNNLGKQLILCILPTSISGHFKEEINTAQFANPNWFLCLLLC